MDTHIAKKQKMDHTPKRHVYVVRWMTHGSDVDEWDDDELENIETCSHDIEEAKGYITGECDCGDAMLLRGGIRKDSGLFGKAYSDIEQARKSMEKCHNSQIDKARGSIRLICGIDEQSYSELLESEEIVEEVNKKGEFPCSAKVVTSSSGDLPSFKDITINWGATECGRDQHEHIRCCISISTRLTCWIESLELAA